MQSPYFLQMWYVVNKVVYFACSHPWSNILLRWIILILKLGSLLYEWFSLAPITLSGWDRFPNCALQPVLVLDPLLSDDSFPSFRPLWHLLQLFHINFHYSDHYCHLNYNYVFLKLFTCPKMLFFQATLYHSGDSSRSYPYPTRIWWSTSLTSSYI